MKFSKTALLTTVAAAALGLASSAFSAQAPTRGMSMTQVKKMLGQPHSVHRSADPVKKQWPRITVWKYPGMNVYFERKTVLHTVRR